MYRKLEDRKTQGKDASDSPETPAADCPCACGEEATTGEDPAPEVNKTGTALAVYYDING